MKKLLSVFAAAAVLFGFASCSGDMHDSVVSSLYAEGDFCEKDGIQGRGSCYRDPDV